MILCCECVVFAKQRRPFDCSEKASARSACAKTSPASLPDPDLSKKKRKKRVQVLFRRPLKKQFRSPERLEIGGFPALGYSVDRGFGVGILLSMARFSPGYYPYRWRLRVRTQFTIRPDLAGGAEFPYQSHYVLLDLPQVVEGLRLQGRVEFQRFSTSGYFGLGNASPLQMPWLAVDPEKHPEQYRGARRFQQYDRIYPLGSLAGRVLLWKRGRERLELFLSGELTYNWLFAYPGSRLEEDIRESAKETVRGRVLRSLLKGFAPHWLFLGGVGLLWDTRDHEFNPTKGHLHEISVRGSPGVDAHLAFVGVNATARFFRPLLGHYLVLAGRLLVDAMWGAVPFYLMAEHGGFFPAGTLGSGSGVRALALGRIHGKFKVLGSVELRSKFWSFRMFGLPMWLGALIFCDAGRAWLDTFQEAALFDGSSSVEALFGLKVSGGGGLRLQWGEAIVVRLDVGYSNTGEFGFYLGTGHAF